MYFMVLENIIKTSIYVSIILMLIFFLKDRLLYKYTHRLTYFLYNILILRMMMIFKFNINISDKLQGKLENLMGNEKMVILNFQPIAKSSVDYSKYIFIFWISGTLLTIAYYIYKQVKFNYKMKTKVCEVEDMNIYDILEREKSSMGIRKKVKLSYAIGISSPMITGIFHSRIVLPKKDYEESKIKWIFRHELTHLKRRDNLLKLIMTVATSMHFFNPLMYVFRKHFIKQCELSCDEMVIKNTKMEDIKEYAKVILDAVKEKNYIDSTVISSSLSNEKISIIERRIKDMLSMKSKKKGILIGALTLAIMGGSLFALNTNKALADTPEDHVNDKVQLQQELKDTLEDSAIKGNVVKTEINGDVAYVKSGSFEQ